MVESTPLNVLDDKLKPSTVLRLVHLDYGGYPCQVQLSRALAARGHETLHLFCPAYVGGKGRVSAEPGDPATFRVEPLLPDEPFERYSPMSRLRHETKFARAFLTRLKAERPDVVIVANVPLLSLWFIARGLRRARVPYVFWQQDVTSHAIDHGARERLGAAGGVIGRGAIALERDVARGAVRMLPLGAAFVPVLAGWGVPGDRVSVVGNWPPLDELPLRPRENEWARKHDLVGRPSVVYAGTLGLKHNPSILLEIAQHLALVAPEARVVVVSEGLGRTWLAENSGGLEQLVLLDFQTYTALPDVLASADVLVAILEPEAGEFSIPSKVLSYLCAGRPIVAVIPRLNAAAQIIDGAAAGVVVSAGDSAGAALAVADLIRSPKRAQQMGAAARGYAEQEFDLAAITDRFENVLKEASVESRA